MTILVGDRERDRAAYELQHHYRDGRLTVEELAQRLEATLRARDGAQLRSALRDLPGSRLRQVRQTPARALRNAAILVGTAVVWLFWSVSLLAAFVAWLAANGPSVGALLAFPALWLVSSWLLWTGSRRRRLRP